MLEAVRAVSRIGPPAAPAVPALTRMLDSADQFEVDRVIDALGALGPAASPALPRIMLAIKQREPHERERSIAPLVQIGDEAVVAVTGLLKSNRFHLREFGAVVLGHMGVKAIQLVRLLTDLQRNDDSADVRRAASQAVAALITGAPPPDPQRWSHRLMGDDRLFASPFNTGG